MAPRKLTTVLFFFQAQKQVLNGSGFSISTGDKRVFPDDQLKSLLGDAKLIELYKFADHCFTEDSKEMKQDLNLGEKKIEDQITGRIKKNFKLALPFSVSVVLLSSPNLSP